jgi:hypothetical protein
MPHIESKEPKELTRNLAIHRRGGRPQGRGGNFGGRRDGGGKFQNRKERHGGHQEQHHNSNNNNQGFEQIIAAPPAVPTFGAPIPGFPQFR